MGNQNNSSSKCRTRWYILLTKIRLLSIWPAMRVPHLESFCSRIHGATAHKMRALVFSYKGMTLPLPTITTISASSSLTPPFATLSHLTSWRTIAASGIRSLSSLVSWIWLFWSAYDKMDIWFSAPGCFETIGYVKWQMFRRYVDLACFWIISLTLYIYINISDVV